MKSKDDMKVIITNVEKNNICPWKFESEVAARAMLGMVTACLPDTPESYESEENRVIYIYLNNKQVDTIMTELEKGKDHPTVKTMLREISFLKYGIMMDFT